jgi:hypothetical protein
MYNWYTNLPDLQHSSWSPCLRPVKFLASLWIFDWLLEAFPSLGETLYSKKKYRFQGERDTLGKRTKNVSSACVAVSRRLSG